MKSKKSQTEILGLAIIVVLVVLGLALYFRFSFVLKENPDLDRVTRSVLAENVIGAMLKTQTECNPGQDFKNLIISCAENYFMPNYALTCSRGTSYCVFLEDRVKKILNSSLDEIQRKEYVFLIRTESTNEEILNITQAGNCIERETGVYPLPTSLGNIIIELRICG